MDGILANTLKLFLCGDVMTGRGIDQILPHPNNPVLYESCVTDAREYVHLAERAHGPIPRGVGFDYIWGDALAELSQGDLRIINLETSITSSAAYWPGKGIHYRMHPRNIGCLTAAKIDACCLANNHVLDWSRAGLAETLASLNKAGIAVVGAGRNAMEAAAPAVLGTPGGRRVLVFAYGVDEQRHSIGMGCDGQFARRKPAGRHFRNYRPAHRFGDAALQKTGGLAGGVHSLGRVIGATKFQRRTSPSRTGSSRKGSQSCTATPLIM